MSSVENPARPAILVVRLGAMGDIIHTMPAVTALKLGYPGAHLTWLVQSKWVDLLEGHPYVDRVLPLHRNSISKMFADIRTLRTADYDLAVDFQGLLKSAIAATSARPDRLFGFDAPLVRERAAAVFYTNRISTDAVHVVDRNLELAAAAGGDTSAEAAFHLPSGWPEGELPAGEFVLACPFAGWGSKQWPIEHYRHLAARLPVPLVLNGAPGSDFGAIAPAVAHYSGIAGLIDATRRCTAVVGVDSGPLHIAAALRKPGVAVFGPTDPARNGPYGGSLRILRTSSAATTYKRGASIAPSMQQVSPEEVLEALRAQLECLAR